MLSTKKIVRYLHLWPGLISAIILFFVCITGTIIVYSDEIIELSAGNSKYVKEIKSERLPANDILKILNETFPNRKPSYMVSYKDPERSVRFNMFSKEDGLRMVYVDPYSGEILKDDNTIYFFYVTAHLHNSLLLGKTGQWIIDIATIIFIIELITGLILWLPKKWNGKTLKNFFTIKAKSTSQRLNYDLHRVLGIYALVILLILSFTGLLIAFEPMSHATMKILGAGDDGHSWQKSLPTFDKSKEEVELNSLIKEAFEKYPKKEEVQIDIFKLETKGYYYLRVADRIGLKSAQSPEYLVYNRANGSLFEIPKETIRHEKIENAVWVLHMGNWMGQLGKLVTFLGGLIASSLPVTGFYIWWNKRKKKA